MKKCMTCCIDKGQCVQSLYIDGEDLHMRTLLLALLATSCEWKIVGPAGPDFDG